MITIESNIICSFHIKTEYFIIKQLVNNKIFLLHRPKRKTRQVKTYLYIL
jgi:hypothetical protein